MAEYMRKIIYLRKEEKGISMPGAGFVRMEKKNGKIFLYIVSEEERMSNGQPIYFVFEKNEEKQAVKFSSTKNSFPLELSEYVSELPMGIKPEKICGILIGGENCYLAGECSEWNGNLHFSDISFCELPPAQKQEVFPTEKEEMEEITILEEEEKETKSVKEKDSLMKKFEEMYPFEDDEMEWCGQMKPSDFSAFPMEYWHYGSNSFLLQGFYNYRHLLYAHCSGKNYVGVPGQFHRREQYLAHKFGFPRFKGTQKKKITVGDFGYWLREL